MIFWTTESFSRMNSYNEAQYVKSESKQGDAVRPCGELEDSSGPEGRCEAGLLRAQPHRAAGRKQALPKSRLVPGHQTALPRKIQVQVHTNKSKSRVFVAKKLASPLL